GVGLSAVRTAAITPTTSSGSSGTGSHGKAGAKDLPLSNGSTTQGLIGASLAMTSAQSPTAFVVQTADVKVSATQPVVIVAPNGPTGAAVPLPRNSAFSGGSESMDDRLSGPEALSVLPAEYQEDKANPATPAGSEVLLDDSSINQIVSRNRVDAYFIMAAPT